MKAFLGQRHRAAVLPPAIEIEIISRLFAAAPQIISIALGLIVGSVIMAVQSGEPIFFVIAGLGLVSSIHRMANIVNFAHRDKSVALSLSEARIWERGYAYSAFIFTLILVGLIATTFYLNPRGGHVLCIGLVMALTAGSYLRTLRFWICATLSTIAIGALALAFLLSGNALYQALSLLLILYLISIYESSDHIIGQFEQLLIARRELEFAAQHDPLTGLINRRGVDLILDEASQSAETVTVLMLDLDGFKQVNDRDGHAAGDELLRQTSARLRGLMRPGDIVSRIGGDEFAVIVRGRQDDEFAAALAARIVSVVNVPFEVLGRRTQIGVSVGIASADLSANQPADRIATLMSRADEALYEAKRAGKGRFESEPRLYVA